MNNKLVILRVRFNEFFMHWYHYGFRYAANGLLWWICFYFRTPLSWRFSSIALKNKTKFLDKYISNHYSEIVNRYCSRNTITTNRLTAKERIWVFWGQGKDAMPPLVLACYKQLIHFNDNVTLLTNENASDYVSLPPIIYFKVRNRQLSWAHYSDILRNTLLAKHGGMWLDATVWVSGKVPLERFDTPIYSPYGTIPITKKSICFWTSLQWNWSTWCMWSRETEHPLYSFVSEMLLAIAENEKCWPDYVLQDYLIYYACRYIPEVRIDLERKTLKNEHRNDLASLMNMDFDILRYRELTNTDNFFKLSFRSTWNKKTRMGKQTFYGRILAGIIDVNDSSDKMFCNDYTKK